jgi:diadenosine tetraphosphate (Ap4A) HIT family hydrolase
MSNSCQLCCLSSENSSSGFLTLFGSEAYELEVLERTQDLLIILDVAPIVSGHVLIVPRSHERSFARYWSNEAQDIHALEDAVAETIFHATGKSVVVCEHGLGIEARGHAGCIEHAHLHIIPVTAPLYSAFAQTGIEFCEVSEIAPAINLSPKQQYLYLKDIDGRMYIATQDRFPSQLVRRLVAQQYGEMFWSWRDYLDFADKINTRQRIIDGKKFYAHLSTHPFFHKS